MDSLFAHLEKSDGLVPASFLLKQVYSVFPICKIIIQVEGK